MTDRVLVTGGLGFIGSNLCRRLLAANPDIELTIVDDCSGTATDWSDLQDRADIIIDDFRAFSGRGFSDVWHLASPVGSLGILGRSGRIVTDIVDLASHAHDLAFESQARLLYVSSSEVYGRDGRHGEESDLVVPCRHGARMEYALGKLSAEHVLYNLSVDSGVEIRTVRPFNCAGPGQSPALGFVVPTFVAAALAGADIPVHGDGSARRAFCHVDDLVDGLMHVQARGISGRLYNVGQPDGVLSILELAERIRTQLGSDSRIVHIDPNAAFGPHWTEAFDKVPDIGRVQRDTGWTPTSTLGRIIDDVAAHVRQHQPAAPASLS